MKKNVKPEEPQIMYNNCLVDRATFRAFVYRANEQKLARSYEEYLNLLSTGLWFSDEESVKPKEEELAKPKEEVKTDPKQVKKDGANSKAVSS